VLDAPEKEALDVKGKAAAQFSAQEGHPGSATKEELKKATVSKVEEKAPDDRDVPKERGGSERGERHCREKREAKPFLHRDQSALRCYARKFGGATSKSCKKRPSRAKRHKDVKKDVQTYQNQGKQKILPRRALRHSLQGKKKLVGDRQIPRLRPRTGHSEENSQQRAGVFPLRGATELRKRRDYGDYGLVIKGT